MNYSELLQKNESLKKRIETLELIRQLDNETIKRYQETTKKLMDEIESLKKCDIKTYDVNNVYKWTDSDNIKHLLTFLYNMRRTLRKEIEGYWSKVRQSFTVCHSLENIDLIADKIIADKILYTEGKRICLERVIHIVELMNQD